MRTPKAKVKRMIVCPHCDNEFDVSQFEELTYEQGKKDQLKYMLNDLIRETHNHRSFSWANTLFYIAKELEKLGENTKKYQTIVLNIVLKNGVLK